MKIKRTQIHFHGTLSSPSRRRRILGPVHTYPFFFLKTEIFFSSLIWPSVPTYPVRTVSSCNSSESLQDPQYITVNSATTPRIGVKQQKH